MSRALRGGGGKRGGRGSFRYQRTRYRGSRLGWFARRRTSVVICKNRRPIAIRVAGRCLPISVQRACNGERKGDTMDEEERRGCKLALHDGCRLMAKPRLSFSPRDTTRLTPRNGAQVQPCLPLLSPLPIHLAGRS